MGTKKKNSPGGCTCCGVEIDCCCGCEYGTPDGVFVIPISSLSVDANSATQNGAATESGGCGYSVPMTSGGNATVTQVSDTRTEPCQRRWKVEHDGDTFYTEPFFNCNSQSLDFETPSDGSLTMGYTATPCHTKCCFPGTKIRIVTGATATVSGIKNRKSVLQTSGVSGYVVSTSCCEDQTIDEVVEDTDATDANGVYNAILYAYAENLIDKTEVTSQELTDALASDLTALIDCQDYSRWFWEFYEITQETGYTYRTRSPDSATSCGAIAIETTHSPSPACDYLNVAGPVSTSTCTDTYDLAINLAGCKVEGEPNFQAGALGCISFGVSPSQNATVLQNVSSSGFPTPSNKDVGSSYGTCLAKVPFLICYPYTGYDDILENGASSYWLATAGVCERQFADGPCSSTLHQLRQESNDWNGYSVVQSWSYTEQTVPCP